MNDCKKEETFLVVGSKKSKIIETQIKIYNKLKTSKETAVLQNENISDIIVNS